MSLFPYEINLSIAALATINPWQSPFNNFSSLVGILPRTSSKVILLGLKGIKDSKKFEKL